MLQSGADEDFRVRCSVRLCVVGWCLHVVSRSRQVGHVSYFLLQVLECSRQRACTMCLLAKTTVSVKVAYKQGK